MVSELLVADHPVPLMTYWITSAILSGIVSIHLQPFFFTNSSLCGKLQGSLH